MPERVELRRIEEFVWEIPKSGRMRVPGRIYGSRAIIDHLLADQPKAREWNALLQVRNVACLPGILNHSLAMADVHPGYGFPIGGVAAFDIEEGVVSVAGVGFDCNCGVRALAAPIDREQVERKKAELAEELYRGVPAGLGSEGEFRLNRREIDDVLRSGAEFPVRRGYGTEADLEYIEERGCVAGANPARVSDRAKERQFRQVGTLGSGNHYLEVQYVDEVYDEGAAGAFGIGPGTVLVAIHTGSRALGHQIGTDYLPKLRAASRHYDLPVPEQELVCAPIDSPEGRDYLSAVFCGINCAFANRQAISHLTRLAFARVFGLDPASIRVLYDVGHNTAKLERHRVGGAEKMVLVHRKGATRAFPAGNPGLPAAYRGVGQPVLVGGTMGTCSYILVGTEKGMAEPFGSAGHGAGRRKSRTQATRDYRGGRVVGELGARGIVVKAHNLAGVAEEAPGAYKDVREGVDAMEGAGVNRKVARLKPMICVKG